MKLAVNVSPDIVVSIVINYSNVPMLGGLVQVDTLLQLLVSILVQVTPCPWTEKLTVLFKIVGYETFNFCILVKFVALLLYDRFKIEFYELMPYLLDIQR